MTSQRNAFGLGALLILISYTHPTAADGMGLAQPGVAAVAAGAGAQLEKGFITPLREALESQVVRYINAQRALHGLPAQGS